MRKELALCDHCESELSRTGANDSEVLAFKIEGQASVSGGAEVSGSSGLTHSISGRISLVQPGEFCSKKCLLAALRKRADAVEESVFNALR